MDIQRVKILLIGAEGTDKHAVSKCLLGIGRDLNLNVLTCPCLPLPDKKDLHQENVSFICPMVQMTNKDSMKVLVESLGQLDVSYFTGRSVIIANTKGNYTDAGIEPSQVIYLAAKYGLQVLFADTENEIEMTELCRKLVRLIETAVCWKGNVTPLLYDTVHISDRKSFMVSDWSRNSGGDTHRLSSWAHDVHGNQTTRAPFKMNGSDSRRSTSSQKLNNSTK